MEDKLSFLIGFLISKQGSTKKRRRKSDPEKQGRSLPPYKKPTKEQVE